MRSVVKSNSYTTIVHWLAEKRDNTHKSCIKNKPFQDKDSKHARSER